MNNSELTSQPLESPKATVTETLISALEMADEATHVFVIMAHEDGGVSIRWSAMPEWQARGIVSAGFDRIGEAFNPDEDED